MRDRDDKLKAFKSKKKQMNKEIAELKVHKDKYE